jgi:hypothetical protein
MPLVAVDYVVCARATVVAAVGKSKRASFAFGASLYLTLSDELCGSGCIPDDAQTYLIKILTHPTIEKNRHNGTCHDDATTLVIDGFASRAALTSISPLTRLILGVLSWNTRLPSPNAVARSPAP